MTACLLHLIQSLLSHASCQHSGANSAINIKLTIQKYSQEIIKKEMKFTIGSKIGFALATLSAMQIVPSIAFTQPSLSSRRYGNIHSVRKQVSFNIQNGPLATSTSLNVWWFGGNDSEQDDESCELVAVRIERTSANSRRIAGDIVIPRPIEDVWAILTDCKCSATVSFFFLYLVCFRKLTLVLVSR